MKDELQSRFLKWLEVAGIAPEDTGRMMEQFEMYFRLLAEWNEKMNLTAITEREAVYEKHFFDSLTVARAADMRSVSSLADIGSGAGFPSLPLKIVFPHLRVTIVDALAKRIRFLEAAVAALGLDHVQCLHGRAEDLARKAEHRDRYDLVTARAVARLASLSELCLPFVRPGGLFVAMKGADIAEELEEGLYAIRKLNGSVRETLRLALPAEGAVRHLIVIAKNGPTPKAFPRKPGVPLKQPLIADGKLPARK